MGELAYVNGAFCELSEARISIEDRGFQFADGVYEVIVAYGDRPFRLAEHLARLERSLDGIHLEFDLKQHHIERIIRDGIARAGFAESMVYLQITRGVAPRSHVHPDGMVPTVVATFKAKPKIDLALRERGLSVVTVDDIRWALCHIKSIALLPAALIKNDVQRRGYDDAIFISADGRVREATAANVFVVRDGALLTPPESGAILQGITRTCIQECAKRIQLPSRCAEVSKDDLAAAQEIFVSSTTIDLLGVTLLNDAPVGDGRVGPITRALHEEIRKMVREGG